MGAPGLGAAAVECRGSCCALSGLSMTAGLALRDLMLRAVLSAVGAARCGCDSVGDGVSADGAVAAVLPFATGDRFLRFAFFFGCCWLCSSGDTSASAMLAACRFAAARLAALLMIISSAGCPSASDSDVIVKSTCRESSDMLQAPEYKGLQSLMCSCCHC